MSGQAVVMTWPGGGNDWPGGGFVDTVVVTGTGVSAVSGLVFTASEASFLRINAKSSGIDLADLSKSCPR